MKKMPSRDTSGRCEGECRDLSAEQAKKNQKEMSHEKYSGGSSPNLSWAHSRSEQPGFYGGHV